MTDKADSELIKDYTRGDEKSLEFLISKYIKNVYNFVYRYVNDIAVAEDITQDTFVKVWKNLKKFDHDKNFKTWLFGIAKNTSIDFLRKKKSIPFSEFDTKDGENIIAETFADLDPLPDEILEKDDISEILSKAILKLPIKYREVVSLKQENEFTFKEISEILKESIDTVKSRYRRALIMLRNDIENLLK